VTNLAALLTSLVDAGVEFILVGGAAGTALGAARLTQDVDVVYAREPQNLQRIVTALSGTNPYPRGAPPGLPFLFDERTLHNGGNFTLHTTLGDIDLLAEITGGGGYSELLPSTIVLHAFGRDIRCLTLRKLIEVKRAAGRPKDFEAIAELELLLEESE
jgi:predicted nucleotidyltransferase